MLNAQLTLLVEKEGSALRLVVTDDGSEIVCHKTTTAKLTDFTNADNGHLFKGRLQLDKRSGSVSVNVKGQEVGIVNVNDFTTLLA